MHSDLDDYDAGSHCSKHCMHSDLDRDAGSHSSEHCMAAPAAMTLEVGSAEGLAPMQKRLLRTWLVEPSTSGPSQVPFCRP